MSGRAVPVAGGPTDPSPAQQILRRALELADQGVTDGPALGPDELRAVAGELGVPASAVAAALAEQQVAAGLPAAGTVSRLVGPVAVVGWRHVEADRTQTERLVASWLEAGHALRVRRLGNGTMIGTRKPGLAGSVARTVRAARGGRDLAGRGEVRASVVPDDEGAGGSVACILVDLRLRRLAAVQGGGAVGMAGLAASVVAGAVLAPPVLLVGVPVSLGAGVATAALRHRAVVRMVTEEVEVTLDGVARRDPPAGAVRDLMRSVSRRARLAPAADGG